MEYKIVASEYRHIIMDEVNKLLQEGWKLQGGISSSWNTTGGFFCQAMVKDKD